MEVVAIRVLLFAAYRELLGARELTLDVPDGATLEDIYTLLQNRQSRLAELRPSTTFALNQEVCPATTAVHSGDVVALLQPVSGGAHD